MLVILSYCIGSTFTLSFLSAMPSPVSGDALLSPAFAKFDARASSEVRMHITNKIELLSIIKCMLMRFSSFNYLISFGFFAY